MTDLPLITIDALEEAVAGSAAAIRSVARLQPVGGRGDKVFPPTFGDVVSFDLHVTGAGGASRRVTHKTKYALEARRVDGEAVLTVLLDSFASQANRMEQALLGGWEVGELPIPIVRVDFTELGGDSPETDLSDLGGDGYLTSLEVPHRIADALLRDSTLDGVSFRASGAGRALTSATPANATQLYAYCPTALIFGVWDSTGPKGGLGSKFARALVSEIVGFGVELGVKTASRIDPTGIEKKAGPIYQSAEDSRGWTLDPEAAPQVEDKPVALKRGGEKAGSPAVINHGNVKPSVEPTAGGVTLDYGLQTTTLSLPGLRRLRFPFTVSGERVEGEARRTGELAARTALAALALAAMAYQRDDGFDLRSRCAFQAEHPLVVELLDRDGGPARAFRLDRIGARDILQAAVARAADRGFGWHRDPIDLRPSDKLVALIRKSRELAMTGGDGGEPA